MRKKKWTVVNQTHGFTLIEVLLSIMILSAVTTGMFMFFTNAMKYTTYNQGKTVAINIARGVLNYMERLDFENVKQYMQTEMDNRKEPFVKIDASSCHAPLFDDETVCRALLRPTINNVVYDENRIQVWLVPYNGEKWTELKNNPPLSLPEKLKMKIHSETSENSDSRLQNYLIRVYVTVRWGENDEDVEVLEGVIANETIR
ncbi:prepilin-type N-terminal cleavage/methylation domain-containing protein [Thermolongibacillus altinsuensis]|uniref:Prepilin-type N-terminal cleavage/methylation domain-containing protein n=1 Tax=Thermolongibacillus altinsuensis TaxID=575256 RepID=A0A4R1QG45_9BACL|nr:prepilin-type N-terminal cleavage/methylation domain-containing protein [Thermolongibacillus altinsuensis]TCL51922.1 prepilin-type N-terminal cleavage/methylation domain-containing protein [Thermolongibacillus altinsuensis]GMB07457.1 hypothetical protein B1no1_01670 [Thermolongibacillus altinsuensis]